MENDNSSRRRKRRSRSREANQFRKERRADRHRREGEQNESGGQSDSARMCAYRVLTEYDATGRFISDLIDDNIKTGKLADTDRKLVHEMTAGVVRNRRLLEAVWTAMIGERPTPPEPGLARLLSLGVYQLLFMSVPDHAAVHETVELAKPLNQLKWVGFANGVLRNIVRQISADRERVQLPTDSITAQPDADVSFSPRLPPLRNNEGFVYTSDVLPDPITDRAKWFATAFSLPDWIAERWCTRFDEPTLLAIAQSLREPGPLTLRVNTLKTNRKEMLKWFDEWDANVTAGDYPDAIRTEGMTIADLRTGLDAGLFSIQDESAMHAVQMLSPEPGQHVLDLCAGPGTKTAQVAEFMNDEGRIVACDVTRIRVRKIQENADRMSLSCIEPVLISKDGQNIPDGPFDAVLVDVPCSNSGVLGKRPEARWRITESDLMELPQQQQELLCRGVERLSATGRICYSTCSIEPEENEQVVQAVLQKYPDLELEAEQLHLPTQGRDGAYAAVLKKRPVTEASADINSDNEAE